MLLLSIEFIEELGSKGCVGVNAYGGGGGMVSECRGLVGWVRVL